MTKFSQNGHSGMSNDLLIYKLAYYIWASAPLKNGPLQLLRDTITNLDQIVRKWTKWAKPMFEIKNNIFGPPPAPKMAPYSCSEKPQQILTKVSQNSHKGLSHDLKKRLFGHLCPPKMGSLQLPSETITDHCQIIAKWS